MLLETLSKKNLIHPPKWLVSNTHYLTLMGSQAYGVHTENSDFDVYGIAIPYKQVVFPHLAGAIFGFGKPVEPFNQWQESHIVDPDALKGRGREYDFTVYGIVRYFQLLMDNNPNVLDSIFTARDCVLHISPIGELIRENRKLFVHKGLWPKFKGYAFSMMSKITSKENFEKAKQLREYEDNNKIDHQTTLADIEIELNKRNNQVSNPEMCNELRHLDDKKLLEYYNLFKQLNTNTRFEKVKQQSFDTKYTYHLIRLLGEAEQLLANGDMDLRLNNEHHKAIRRGEVPLADIERWAADKEASLEKLYHESKLPWGPREPEIKTLLLKCLEQAFGSLDKAITIEGRETDLLRRIAELTKEYAV